MGPRPAGVGTVLLVGACVGAFACSNLNSTEDKGSLGGQYPYVGAMLELPSPALLREGGGLHSLHCTALFWTVLPCLEQYLSALLRFGVLCGGSTQSLNDLAAYLALAYICEVEWTCPAGHQCSSVAAAVRELTPLFSLLFLLLGDCLLMVDTTT
jgi:hypothetical protein